MPKFTTCTSAGRAEIHSEPGRVVFNGASLLPFEAAMLADALSECADRAEQQGELLASASRLQVQAARADFPLVVVGA